MSSWLSQPVFSYYLVLCHSCKDYNFEIIPFATSSGISLCGAFAFVGLLKATHSKAYSVPPALTIPHQVVANSRFPEGYLYGSEPLIEGCGTMAVEWHPSFKAAFRESATAGGHKVFDADSVTR